MVKNIVFYNFFSIGDVWLSKGSLSAIISQNPEKNFSYLIREGGAFFSDIERLHIKYIDTDGIPNQIAHRYTNYAYIDDDTIGINTWIGAICCNGESCEDIECLFEKIQACMITQIERANYDGAELVYNPVCWRELLPTLPNIKRNQIEEKFTLWKSTCGYKKIMFYYNFTPRSGQIFTIKSHDLIIKELASKLPDTMILFSLDSPELESCGLPNIMKCGNVFKIERHKSCAHLVQFCYIANMCDACIDVDVGASMLYCNNELLSTNTKHIMLTSYPDYRFYSRLRANFHVSDSDYESHVVPMHVDEHMVSKIISRLEIL